MTVAASRRAKIGTAREPSGPARRRPPVAAVGLLPFAAYVLLFLAVPTVLAVAQGFFTHEGAFTVANLGALTDPVVLRSFAASGAVSAVTAVVGAVVGALLCYALLGFPPHGMIRTVVDAVSGVLAQFGGVMLAFAFIATIGLQGLITLQLKSVLHVDLFADGPWIYDLPGLLLPYVYFQVPLMVITFLPAMTSLKPEWYEANTTLGGTRARFWTRVAAPVLAPSFFACLLLLFANAFSSYATAAALVSQGAPIVPLQIRSALTSETVLGRENVAGVLALGMVVVMAVVMTLYALVQRRAQRWRS